MKPSPFGAIISLLLASAGAALAQSEACVLFPVEAQDLTCTCGPGPHELPIWGSGPYSADSHICTAAVHAGVLGREGGEVTAIRVSPPGAYRGTTANGVTSQGWAGPYGTAYIFKGTETKVPPSCGPLAEAAELHCTCEHGAPLGEVWGSGPYSADSDICTAARHAGVITHTGGEVRVRREVGQPSYTGSLANGITTSDRGSYEASLTFMKVQ